MVKGGELKEESLGVKEDVSLMKERWKESLKNDQAPSIKKNEEKDPEPKLREGATKRFQDFPSLGGAEDLVC